MDLVDFKFERELGSLTITLNGKVLDVMHQLKNLYWGVYGEKPDGFILGPVEFMQFTLQVGQHREIWRQYEANDSKKSISIDYVDEDWEGCKIHLKNSPGFDFWFENKMDWAVRLCYDQERKKTC